MNRKLALLLASSLAAAACGGSNNEAAPSGPMDARTRDAMPTSDTVAMSPPDSSRTGQRAAHPDSSVGDASVFLGDTVSLGVSVNTGVALTLDLIKSITDLPATVCTDQQCTWGPGALPTDPVAWQLVVSYDNGSYNYALSGEARSGGDGQLHAVITGSATPSGIPHRGTGSFSVDFDEAKVLNPAKTEVGKLQVTYSNATVGAATIQATFSGVKDDTNPAQTDNALYSYAEDGQGGGSLQASSHNLTSNDRLAIDSRWIKSGAGRADVAVSIADNQGGAFSATESECWASATSSSPAPYHVVYFTSSDAANLGPDSGSAADCAFPTASPTTLSAP